MPESEVSHLISYWESIKTSLTYQLIDVSAKCFVDETIKYLKELQTIKETSNGNR